MSPSPDRESVYVIFARPKPADAKDDPAWTRLGEFPGVRPELAVNAAVGSVKDDELWGPLVRGEGIELFHVGRRHFKVRPRRIGEEIVEA